MKRSSLAYLLSLLLSCSSFLVPFSRPARAVVLKAGVEHSERVEPVEAVLAPGQVFDRRLLPLNSSNEELNHWYKVPAWLAGTWHKDTQTDFYRYEYASRLSDTNTRVIPARSDGIWGTQQDDTGQIWQYDPVPFVTTVDGGEQYIVQLVRSSEPVEITDQQLVRRSLETQIKVDKATQRILSVETGEQITTYVPEDDGLIKRETSAKVFDRSGMPLLLGKSFAYERRIAPFIPRPVFEGKDIQTLFKQFIQSQEAQGSNNSQ